MEIFNGEHPWETRVNFIDNNNVVLGYDMNHQCCEDYGWYITDSKGERLYNYTNKGRISLDGYIFDTDYFKEFSEDEGYRLLNTAQFKIVSNDDHYFINLFNTHNGYYTHGFRFSESVEKSNVGEHIVHGGL